MSFATKTTEEFEQEGYKQELPKKGSKKAIIAGFFDKGEQEVTYEGKTSTKQQVEILFMLDAKKEKGEHFFVSKTYTPTLIKDPSTYKGNLPHFHLLINDAELDLSRGGAGLLGQTLEISIGHKKSSKGTEYAFPSSYAPLEDLPIFDGKKVIAPYYKDKIEECEANAGEGFEPSTTWGLLPDVEIFAKKEAEDDLPY